MDVYNGSPIGSYLLITIILTAIILSEIMAIIIRFVEEAFRTVSHSK